jgi:hypothetical protein
LLAVYDAAIKDFERGKIVKVDEIMPEGLKNLLLSITNLANQPFARELWTTNPVSMLLEITAPVSILIGTKDIQVDWQADIVEINEPPPAVSSGFRHFHSRIFVNSPRGS